MNPTVEWHPGPDFAEYAEALGIQTSQIMAARPADPTAVIFTPETSEDDLDPETPVYVARLARDRDGILRQVGDVELARFSWIEMQSEIESEITRRLNDAGA